MNLEQENEWIGDLKRTFISPIGSFKQQTKLKSSPSLIVGNISLAFQRGVQAGEENKECIIEKYLEILREEFPEVYERSKTLIKKVKL